MTSKKNDKRAKVGRWAVALSGLGSAFLLAPPPLVPQLPFITPLLGIFTIFSAERAWRPGSRSYGKRFPPIVRAAAGFILLAIAFFVAYFLVLPEVTVIEPQTDAVRFQIGFGLLDWGLTSEGRHWKERDPAITPVTMVLNEAAFSREGIAGLWTKRGVYGAGICLIVLYLGTFTSWSIAWGLLLNYEWRTQPDDVVNNEIQGLLGG